MITSILLILLLLLLSAFFSGMEIAFTSKNRLKLEIDRKQSRMFDFIADLFARHPGQYITTILVGNNIALVIYSLCMSLFLRTIAGLLGWTEVATEGSVALETAVSTVVIIFVAEFLPKSIFRNDPNFYYRTFAPIIYFFYILLYPIARFTTIISHGILRLMGRRVSEQSPESSFDRADLASLLDTNNTDNHPHESDNNEIKLFQNALDFADLRVRDCMVPRVDIESVDVENTTIEQLTTLFVESMYSRIFVWEKSIDNIIGYVNSKSLFHRPATIAEVLMKVNFVPETMPLQALLQTLIKHKSNIAVVIDEFGGTAGVISLEDVLEQIFGEIEDEHDVSDLIEKQVDINEYVLSCRLEVKYLNEKYNLGIAESKDYDTLAGYIIYQHEGIPVAGETLVLGGLELKILRTTRSRIELARVKKL
ncbi:MAG: hemolysin family protein [Alistipes sp.]